MDRVRQMFRAHPAPASDAGDEAFALVRVMAECTLVCTTCADACLEEPDPSSLRRCIRTNLDCADVCAATDRLLSRPGPQDHESLRSQLEACRVLCRACAEECDKHAGKHEHCRICA